jgi:hypothetical protein
LFKVTVALNLLFLFSSGFVCPLFAEQEAIRVYRLPSNQSQTLALLDGRQSIEIRGIHPGWVEVSVDDTVGWIEACDFFRDRLFVSVSPFQTKPEPNLFAAQPSRVAPKGNSLSELLDFVFGKKEELSKMSDPHYQHKISSVSSQWGPLFQRKTNYYSWRGIHLAEMWGERLCLNLVKGKTNYAATFGPQWTSHLQDVVLKSNRGVLANRNLFGRGQSFFLEVRYSF